MALEIEYMTGIYAAILTLVRVYFTSYPNLSGFYINNPSVQFIE